MKLYGHLPRNHNANNTKTKTTIITSKTSKHLNQKKNKNERKMNKKYKQTTIYKN